MHEMRLFYTPVWQASVANGEADWPALRAAMLARIEALESDARTIRRDWTPAAFGAAAGRRLAHVTAAGERGFRSCGC